MHVQSQHQNFSLATIIKLNTFVLILWESACRLGSNLPSIIDFNNLFIQIGSLLIYLS